MLYGLGQVGTAVGQVLNLLQGQVPWWVLILGAVLPWFIPIAVGLFLFAFPGRVVNQILGADEPAKAFGSLPSARIEEAVLAVLGIYVLARGLSDAAYWCSRVKLYRLYLDQ